jgi:hypothetical protein
MVKILSGMAIESHILTTIGIKIIVAVAAAVKISHLQVGNPNLCQNYHIWVIVTAQTFCQDSFVTCDIDHISACQLPP